MSAPARGVRWGRLVGLTVVGLILVVIGFVFLSSTPTVNGVDCSLVDPNIDTYALVNQCHQAEGGAGVIGLVTLIPGLLLIGLAVLVALRSRR